MRGCVTRGVESASESVGALRVVSSKVVNMGAFSVNLVMKTEPEIQGYEWFQSCSNAAADIEPQWLGIQRNEEDGFLLHPLTRQTFGLRGTVAVLPGENDDADNCLVGSTLKLFGMNDRTVKADLMNMLDRLGKETEQSNEELMAALMFSCCARGPKLDASSDDAVHQDAFCFHQSFPKIPLLGFYANGEIGPMARGEVKDAAFQIGNATLQGYTAVFGVFIKPKVDGPLSRKFKDVVGTPERLQEYIKLITTL